MTGIDWQDLRVLMAVAEGGSVRAAAAHLGLHHSTVTRRLDQLQRQLGTKLFTRTPAGLKLNNAGAEVLAGAERMAREVDGLESGLSGRDQRLEGEVRLALPDLLAFDLLMHDLARFMGAYPGISIELVCPGSVPDTGRDAADVFIRATSDPPEHLIGRPLGRYAMAVYGRADGRASGATWIASGDVRETAISRELTDNASQPMRCPDPRVRLAAVRAGAGLALLPCVIADPHPELVRLDRSGLIESEPIWLLMGPEQRGSARIRALVTHLVESFQRHQDALLGVAARARVA